MPRLPEDQAPVMISVAMIPYFPAPRLHLFGNVTIHLFGALVALGVMLGARYAGKRAIALKVPAIEMEQAILWVLIPGFIASHWLDLIFYTPQRLSEEGPWVIFKFWDGMSSFGGFLGAFVGFQIFRLRLGKPVWVHADILVQALVIGWIFGRLGCTLVMDHPGALSDFVLAFDRPGGARHNLGFYELLYTLGVLTPAVWLLNRRPRPPGQSALVISLLYAVVRFFLDFFRAEDGANVDPRYFGLTFAQYCCLALVVFAALMISPGSKMKITRGRG